MDYSLTLYTTTSDLSDATSPYYTENVGGLYLWGDTENKRVSKTSTTHSTSASGIQGTGEDTAKNIWGSNWQMPTMSQIDDLLSTTNCTITYNFSLRDPNLVGTLVTGKGDYASNCIFLPSGGYVYGTANVQDAGTNGTYWSATYYNDTNARGESIYYSAAHDTPCLFTDGRSVRPILVK